MRRANHKHHRRSKDDLRCSGCGKHFDFLVELHLHKKDCKKKVHAHS
jgi:transposase-like protein